VDYKTCMGKIRIAHKCQPTLMNEEAHLCVVGVAGNTNYFN